MNHWCVDTNSNDGEDDVVDGGDDEDEDGHDDESIGERNLERYDLSFLMVLEMWHLCVTRTSFLGLVPYCYTSSKVQRSERVHFIGASKNQIYV